MRNPVIKNKKTLLCLTLAFMMLFFCSYCEAAVEERNKIASLDFSESSFVGLNKSLSQGNLLDYLKVREKLILLSYDDLAAVKERVKGNGSLPELNNLLDVILDKMERKGNYLLEEDMFINNTPVLRDFPFYEGPAQGYNITALRPYAEHLYFNNLRLKYVKNNLVKKAELLWVNRDKIKRNDHSERGSTDTEFQIQPFDDISVRAVQTWSYILSDDNLSDYLISSRQWIKEYEENSLYPVVYGDALIMRNASTIFCIDSLSGKEIWFFKDPSDSGSSLYNTFRRPHINMHGYQLLLADNMVFTELGEKLVALTLKEFYNPKLLWERGLGEYAVCTKPVRNDNSLIVGLINARGELWVSAFNCKDGELQWSTYIGTCSFLSPPCQLSLIKDGQLFLGTNNGVLVSLRLNDGKLIWLREYKSRSYSLFDYWELHFSEKNLIAYDTQFLEAEGQKIYYKPRESEYLYILDSEEGRLQDAILIDTDGYRILKIKDGKGIFLAGTNKADKNAEIKIIDLSSGKEIYTKNIKGGALKGVFSPRRDEVLYKIDNILHILRISGDKIEDKEVDMALKDSWLVGASMRFIFTADKRALSCLDISDQKYPFPEAKGSRKEYFESIEKLKNDLKKALQLNPSDNEAAKLRKRLVAELSFRSVPLPLGEIFTVITDNLDRLRDPNWREFTLALLDQYGEKIVIYRDIEIVFKNLLTEAGLLDRSPLVKSWNSKDEANKSVGSDKDFKIIADKIFPVPIKTVEGQRLPDFFLLLNRDQLLCINENGKILWSKKIFYRPYPTVNRYVNYDTDKNVGRMYADDVEAYFYRDVLIINDRVNIIALNAKDGSYIWSMTSKRDIFEKEREFPPPGIDMLYSRYGFDRAFLKNVMLHSEFLGDKFIVVHGNKVYSISPLTGYCERYCELDIEGAIGLSVSGEKIYIASCFLDSLKVLDAKLRLLKNIPLDFINDKNSPLDLLFVSNRVVLHCGSDLYVVDAEDGSFKGKTFIDSPREPLVETSADKILVFVPFEKIVCYSLEKDALTIAWEFNVESADQEVLWKYGERKTRYYFIVDRRILLPFRRNWEFFFACVSLDTGEKIWEKNVPGVKGFFYDLSSGKECQDTINFIMTTGCEEMPKKELEYYSNLISIFISSKLCTMNISNGKTIRKEKMPSLISDRSILKSDLVETSERFVYVINGEILIIKSKHL